MLYQSVCELYAGKEGKANGVGEGRNLDDAGGQRLLSWQGERRTREWQE
jgi:hypothetical protein